MLEKRYLESVYTSVVIITLCTDLGATIREHMIRNSKKKNKKNGTGKSTIMNILS